MPPQPRTYVWQMVREAIQALGGQTTNVALRDWILKHYPGTKSSTIQCHIIACTVNHPSRIHYQNRKPRTADTQKDFLFRPERGRLELYDPARHGVWEIVQLDDGRLEVRRADREPVEPEQPEPSGLSGFAAEDHLRDYLAQHLHLIEDGLELYVDDDGNVGVEYPTDVGRIDILAVDAQAGLVVIELKLGRCADAVCGRLLRYRGWVRRHLANGRRVRGYIIAHHISDRIRYAVADVEDVHLMEYELDLRLRDVPELEPQGSAR